MWLSSFMHFLFYSFNAKRKMSLSKNLPWIIKLIYFIDFKIKGLCAFEYENSYLNKVYRTWNKRKMAQNVFIGLCYIPLKLVLLCFGKGS